MRRRSGSRSRHSSASSLSSRGAREKQVHRQPKDRNGGGSRQHQYHHAQKRQTDRRRSRSRSSGSPRRRRRSRSRSSSESQKRGYRHNHRGDRPGTDDRRGRNQGFHSRGKMEHNNNHKDRHQGHTKRFDQRNEPKKKEEYIPKAPHQRKLGPEFMQEELTKWKNIQNQNGPAETSGEMQHVPVDEQTRIENEEMERKEREIAERQRAQQEWIESLKQKRDTQEQSRDVQGEGSPQKQQQEHDDAHGALQNQQMVTAIIEEHTEIPDHESEGSDAFADVKVDLEIIEKRTQPTAREQPKKKGEKDMFALDDDDSVSEEADDFLRKTTGRQLDYDDEEQYYRTQVGEMLHNQFVVSEQMGKGMYGTVLRAKQVGTNIDVAIKVIKLLQRSSGVLISWSRLD